MQEEVVIVKKTRVLGHLAVLLTMSVWATTYVSSKQLLAVFTPSQILVVRSTLGLFVLTLINHKPLVYAQRGDRLLVALAGFCGIFLYYFLENTALLFTSASNVGVIVATAPFFTLLASHLFLKEEKLRKNYFVGLALSMSGIILLTFTSTEEVAFNPKGDLLALLAIMVWALYTVLTRVIGRKGYPNLLVTRNMFFYGLIGHTLVLLISREALPLALVIQTPYLYHFLFLGLIASAFCFLTWNFGLRTIGAIKSSFYLYLSPLITIAVAVTLLSEPFGQLDAIGTALTLSGLLISEYKSRGV
ncbi:DMT family transporter [Sphaerochaeta sp. UBA5836]|jgi:drug/metabolite transporter (DMT)-like permease|uniref:DMT family transporter n=1 Tax=Sphaerochaeta sp. UBA5836 TaxID=1947474 RepID=UPI0025DC3119|nr:DMT family transporter [Sphaerochaeta sp. UBA5836]